MRASTSHEIDPRQPFTLPTQYPNIDSFLEAINALPPVPPEEDDELDQAAASRVETRLEQLENRAAELEAMIKNINFQAPQVGTAVP